MKKLHFTYQDASHLEKWKRHMITTTGQTFGDLSSNIFILDEYPPPLPRPEQPDEPWDDNNDPGGIEREFLRRKIDDIMLEERRLRIDKPKLFKVILQSLSDASITQVKQRVIEDAQQLPMNINEDLLDSRAIWDRFVARGDPLELWLVIKKTHLSSRTASSRLDRYKALHNY